MTAELRSHRPLLLLVLYSTAIASAEGPTRWMLAAPLAVVPFLAWILSARNAWLSAYLVIAMIAPPLPIALGNSGLHPAILLAALGVVVGMFRVREWRLERSGLTVALVLFFTVLIFSSALAAVYSGPAIGVESLERACLAGISVYVFLYGSAGPGRRGNLSPALLYTAALASAAFACLDFFYPFPAPATFGNQFIWLDSGVYRRAQGLFYEAGTLGNFCAFGVVISAVALVRGVGRRSVLIAGTTVFTAALILSYSRASALNLAVALGALAFLQRPRIRRRGVAGASGVTLACAGLTYALFPNFTAAYWTRLWFSTTNLFSYATRIFGGRLESWATLLRFLAANPWHAIVGVGYKTLPYSDFIGARVVADNMYLSLLAETGIVGLGLLLAMNFLVLRAGYRAAHSNDREKSFYGTAIFCLWAGQTVQMVSADVLTFWRVLPMYFWVLAMAVRR